MSSSRVNERLLLVTLAAVQFTHTMDYMILMPLGSQLMRMFAIGPAQFSHLVAAYSLAAATTGLIGGFVLDRLDRKRALLTLYAGFGLATLACALAPNYPVLLLARVAAGAFGGLAASIVTAIVGDVVPPERRGAALGVVMTSFPIASVLGVPTGLFLAGLFEWHAPFFLLVGLSIIVGFFAWKLLPALPPHPTGQSAFRQMGEIVSHPVHIRAFALSVVLVFAGGCIIPFMAPSMVANVGLTEAQLPLVYLAGGAFTFFTMPWFGRLADRHDKLNVFAAVSAFACIAVAVLTQLSPVPVLVALVATTAFMIGMSGRFPPATALITNSVEARYRGGFMAVNSAVQQASGAFANLVAGLIVTQDIATGRLEGYTHAGYLAIAAFVFAVYLASRLRAAAPHAAAPHRPAKTETVAEEPATLG